MLGAGKFNEDAAVQLLRIAAGAVRDMERLKDRTPTLWEVVTGEFDGRLPFRAIDEAVRDAERLAAKHSDKSVHFLGEQISTPAIAQRLREVQQTMAPARRLLEK